MNVPNTHYYSKISSALRLQGGHEIETILDDTMLYSQNHCNNITYPQWLASTGPVVEELRVPGSKSGQEIMNFLPPPVFFRSSFSSFPQKNTQGVTVNIRDIIKRKACLYNFGKLPIRWEHLWHQYLQYIDSIFLGIAILFFLECDDYIEGKGYKIFVKKVMFVSKMH